MQWIWVSMAAVLFASALPAQTNTPIPLQVNPPNIANPLDTYRQILELREQQERIRQLQEQTQQVEEQRAAAQRRKRPKNSVPQLVPG